MEQLAHASDLELLQRLQARDTLAFATLYDRHSRAAYALAWRILGEPAGIEDVLQEAFLEIWRRPDAYQPGHGSVQTWLLAIVHHRAIDARRRRSYREDRQQTLEDVDLPADSSDTWELVRQSVEGQRVREALARLPRDQQDSIVLAYFGGYTHEEIARLLGVPLGTVKGRLRIGLQKLRSYLRPQDREAPG
jgi:RNA polymerase sigma-70 factor (ECF subfamily)